MSGISDPSLQHPVAGDPAFASTSRGEVAYWEIGSGRPAVCLHGFPDHPLGILPFAEQLAAGGFRCICPALPGYWPSSAVSDYAIPAVAADLLELLDLIDIQETAFIGHDWGAVIGYFLASRAPERLSRLVALAVPHPAGFGIRRSEFAELRTAWYAIFLAYAPGAAKVAGDPRWLTALVQSWSRGFWWGDWPRVLDLILRPGVMDAVCAYYRADMEADLEHEPVTVPTTVIHGGQDGCIRPTAFLDLERWFTRELRTELLPRVGHWPHLEDLSAATRIVAQALERDRRNSA